METNVSYTIVGLFVISLFAAIIMGVIWLSVGFKIETNTTYKVYMKESVSGLNVDAPVEFNGVNVGTVKRIQIDQQDPQSVELLLSVNDSTPVTAGTRAMMNTRGLTGVGFIALQDKGLDREPLKKMPHEEYMVIPTAPSLFLRIDTALSKFNESMRNISDSIQSLLNKDNLDSIQQSLKNIETLSRDLSPLIKTSNDAIYLFSNQTLPMATQTLMNLDGVISNLNSITAEMKQNPSVIIRGKTARPLGPGEK
jgi:phospholipid/cholesterol/gamma-HCH transport system substrate-binding protein